MMPTPPALEYAAPATASFTAERTFSARPRTTALPVRGDPFLVVELNLVCICTSAITELAAVIRVWTASAVAFSSRDTLTVTGVVVTACTVSEVPGITSPNVFDDDVTVSAVAPEPRVILASWAAVRVVRSRPFEPTVMVPVVPDVDEANCRNQAPSDCFTAPADTPVPAAFTAAATAARLLSPVSTAVTVAEPTRRPVAALMVMLPPPAAALYMTPTPVWVTVTSGSVPMRNLPSVPVTAVASTLRPSEVSAEPPVICRLADEPSRVVATDNAPVAASADTLTSDPSAVCTAVASWLRE